MEDLAGCMEQFASEEQAILADGMIEGWCEY